MITTIQGIIANASSIAAFKKKDGSESYSAMLHIKESDNVKHPQEVAVKVTGENTYYAQCVGMEVKVEYCVRVFAFADKKTGQTTYGNDIYARRVEFVNAGCSADIDNNNSNQ